VCTVVVSVAPSAPWPVVFLGLRDEAADRPWDPPAAWWPELGDRVQGVHDREAGGAWLATATGPARAAVVLNRREQAAEPEGGWATRGTLPLWAAAAGEQPTGRPRQRPFTLLTADADGALVTSWDGRELVSEPLVPGVHVLTHGAVDDGSVPRVTRWMPRFRAVGAPSGPPPADPASPGLDGLAALADTASTWRPWLEVLRESTALDEHDPEALVRSDLLDGRWLGSLSLSLVAVARDDVRHEHVRLDDATRRHRESPEPARG
jgi:hypothetical protein